jgi:predicted RNase H-like HicB family nuclease
MKYPVLISPTETGFSASVPDLPGCVAVGGTRQETLSLMAEAIELHLEGMREDGEEIPDPSGVELVETRG